MTNPDPSLVPSWRDKYDLDERILISDDTGLDCSGDIDLAVQADEPDSNINEIMRRFGRTGQLPAPREIPMYGDFSGIEDYQTTLEQLREADAAFASLPSKIRNRFNNNPGALLEFIHHDANHAEAIELGLIPNPVLPPPSPAPPAP